MSLSMYRKYRPSTFKDVIGQPLIKKIICEAAKDNNLSHAYLFAGPRGTGKTTTARLIAKIANCIKRQNDNSFSKEGEPCNACEACVAIDEMRSLDVIEIDAASNRGIDEIRNLKENIRLAPAHLQKKVFIIDEAHMLTKEAWNALLKTLEEPPEYVIIILATTEIEKVPATIASRAQQFHFKRASMQDIMEKLKNIATKEKVNVNPEALELIASSAEGSFRDAESLLDQFFNVDDEDITVEEVEQAIGKVGLKKLAEFCETLLNQELESALQKIEEIHESGHNVVLFTKDVIQYLRRAAVLKYDPKMKPMFEKELSKEHLEKLCEHSKMFKEQHIRLLKSLIGAYSNMRYSQFPIIPLEVAVIEELQSSKVK